MKTELHIYRKRYLFHGDAMIGKADRSSKVLWLEKQHANHADEAALFVRRVMGWKPQRVQCGDCPPPRLPYFFPPEIAAITDPARGCMTPAVLEWARANLTAEQWGDIYGRTDIQQHPEAPREAESEAMGHEPEHEPEKKAPRRGRPRKKIEPTKQDERTDTTTESGADTGTDTES